MRVFVTGASGLIGSAVLPELIGAGHEVVGLARSDASAEVIAAAGAKVHYGDLDDHGALRAGASESDGVIHLAFVHDFANYEAANDTDRRAIEALGAALEGSERPLVIASGIAAVVEGRAATERDAANPDFPRSAAANLTIALAERGVRSSVVRLPPTVHGAADKHGFVPMLIDVARRTGVSGYVGAGANCWPAVHQLDAAHLFRLAVEGAPPASVLHAIGDEGVPTRSIAEAIGRHLGVEVASVAPEDAVAHFDWLGVIFAMDIKASSAITQELLGWEPTQPGLLADLDQGHYFA